MTIETATAAVLPKLAEAADAFDSATATAFEAELAASQILAYRALERDGSSGSSGLFGSLSDATASAGPGSNGYLFRKMWLRNGSYSWTAKSDGKIKGQVLGAAGGGGRQNPGAGGGFSEFERTVSEGDVLLITIAKGGEGRNSATDGDSGGTTTIVCEDAGINILITGAQGGRTLVASGGVASGGDVNYPGGDGTYSNNTPYGGSSSGNPRGPGYPAKKSGGAGWGGSSRGTTGASSHFRGSEGGDVAAPGLMARGGVSARSDTDTGDPNGESRPWWDLRDIDGGGAAVGGGSDGANGGTGAGGGAGNIGGRGGLGGGGARSSTGSGGDGGNGGGGGASQSTQPDIYGGNGGDAFFILFFNAA